MTSDELHIIEQAISLLSKLKKVENPVCVDKSAVLAAEFVAEIIEIGVPPFKTFTCSEMYNLLQESDFKLSKYYAFTHRQKGDLFTLGGILAAVSSYDNLPGVLYKIRTGSSSGRSTYKLILK